MSRSKSARSEYDRIRRFGVIVSSVNTVVEPEFYSLGLKDVSFHFVGARNREGSVPADLQAMTDEAPEVAVNLADANPERVLFACTSGASLTERGSSGRSRESSKARVSVPTVTTATAAVDAFNLLGVSRIGLGTPYLDWVGDAGATFFAAAGIESVVNSNLGIKDGHVIAALRPAEVRELAYAVNHRDAEAIFLSCTDLPTFDVVRDLELEPGKPVVSSNIAGIWSLVGHDARLNGLGHLFTRMDATPAR